MSFRYRSQEELGEHLTSLLEEDAENTRLVLKYHNGKKELTARATDDNMCLKFKTSDQTDLQDTKNLLLSAMTQMCELTPEDIEIQRDKLSGGKKKKKKAARS